VKRIRGELAKFVAEVFASLPRAGSAAVGCVLSAWSDAGWAAEVIQPMAERLPDGTMQALQQFVNQSPQDPLPVRRRIAERLVKVMTPEVRVVGDVSFPKCGRACRRTCLCAEPGTDERAEQAAA
jgi:hypothetical protein